MSINAAGSSNFISNEAILTWMQEKTDGIYGHLRDSMDTSNARAHAEDALNTIKAKIIETKNHGGDASEVRQVMKDALTEYKDIPEIGEVLGPLAKDLDAKFDQADLDYKNNQAQADSYDAAGDADSQEYARQLRDIPHATVTISSGQVDDWTKEISDKVEGLAKQDQLGLITIQEFNAQLNQARQTASALIDAADKSASSIINHIS